MYPPRVVHKLDDVPPVCQSIPIDEYDRLKQMAHTLNRVRLAHKAFMDELAGDDEDALAWKFLYRLQAMLAEEDGVNSV